MVPLMSFWPSVYNNIISQKKLFEYRRSFPKDCTYAYMYISKPVKAVCGIIYFGKKYSIEDWKKIYSGDEIIMKRIEQYSKSYRYAMEIKAIQKIQPITLEKLRQNIEGFTAPQSYLLLENNAELREYLMNEIKIEGELIENNLEDLFPEHVCLSY